MVLRTTLLGIVALGTITALREEGGTNNIENVTQRLPCGDYIKFVNTTEPIWTVLGSQKTHENITCQVDYNFTVINATWVTFERNFTPEGKSPLSQQEHLVIIQISKTNVTLRSTVKDYQNLPRNLQFGFELEFTHVGFEILLYQSQNNSCGVLYVKQGEEENNENNFSCELRVRESAVDKTIEEGCLHYYNEYCTNRQKGPNVTVFNDTCKKTKYT